MTKGDTVTLTDTLPAGPNGTPAPAYKVTSFTVTPRHVVRRPRVRRAHVRRRDRRLRDAREHRPARAPYSAPSAVGAPSGGHARSRRQRDDHDHLRADHLNTAPCATITNTATVKDRPTSRGPRHRRQHRHRHGEPRASRSTATTSRSPRPRRRPTVTQNGTITWTITVTNNGPGDMAGPDDTTANPLVITDSFPSGSSVTARSTSTQTGPAGPCTLSGSTITCTNGLAAGATETLLYTQTVKSGAANGDGGQQHRDGHRPEDRRRRTTRAPRPPRSTNAPTLNLKKTVVEPGQRGRPVHGRHRQRRDAPSTRRPPAAPARRATDRRDHARRPAPPTR